MKSLFICYTPLHVLILKKLIEQKNYPYSLLYYYEVDSDKNKYYFSLLGDSAQDTFYVRKTQPLKDFFFLIRQLRLIKKSGPYTSVYCGNIKTVYSRLVLWLFRQAEIYTVDDGIGNINLDPSNYFIDNKERRVSWFFFSLFGSDYLYKNIKKKIKTNYTIYKYQNIFDNSTFVNVFGEPQKNETEYVGDKLDFSILLTGALYTENVLKVDKELKLYEKIILERNINLVIKHPRQSINHLSQFKNVSASVKIAEQQIHELMGKYNIIVYGTFYSSVLVNLPPEVKRVNVIVESKHNSAWLNEFFGKLGIEVLHMKIEN